jgi:uncharacterized protein (DUF305 family)
LTDVLPDRTAAPAARGRRVTVVLALALVLLAAGFWAFTALRPGGPDDASPEAGFARDMSNHHAQAVQMSFAVRDATDDDEIRLLAYDMINTQSQQIGMMQAWLDRWGVSKADPGGAMRWMAGHGHTTPGGAMPGMLTRQQLDELSAAKGEDAEKRFLQLMITHHRGAVTMAEAALRLADDGQVRRLARTIVNGQQSEIGLMTRMLADRGATP